MKFIFFLLTLLIPFELSAEPRSREQAKAIAQTLAERLCTTISENTITEKRIAPTKSGSNPYYIFDFASADGGFAIVSADDRWPEIVGYADRGTFSEQNMPSQLKAFLNAYTSTVNSSHESHRSTLSNSSLKPILPLLDSIEWSQWSPYNLECPEIRGEHAMTGCSATAAAQIMRYHRFPVNQVALQGYTTATYRINIPSIPSSTAAEDQYDWDDMLPTYTSTSTEQQQNAVAKLMYHVGVAMKMDYGLSGSDANYLASYKAFTAFGYDTSLLQYVSRSNYSLEEWRSIIMRELTAGRPIFYCGQSPHEGHSFVCDGIDANGLLHINWGWGGSCNGYFDINVLNPADYDEDDSSFGGYCGFNMMVIGITPENTAGESKIGAGTETTSEWTEMDATVSCEYDKLYYNPGNTYYNKILFTFTNNGTQDFYGSSKITRQYNDDESSAKTVYDYISIESGKSMTYSYELALGKTSTGMPPSKVTFSVYKSGSTVLTQETFDVETGTPSAGIEEVKEFKSFKVQESKSSRGQGCYDLSGRRASNDTKDVKIINGKKLY